MHKFRNLAVLAGEHVPGQLRTVAVKITLQDHGRAAARIAASAGAKSPRKFSDRLHEAAPDFGKLFAAVFFREQRKRVAGVGLLVQQAVGAVERHKAG